MYSGGAKLGRGGATGRGGGKRSSMPLPSSYNRPSSSAGRLSGGSHSRPATSSATSQAGADESFSLVRGNPINFAMIIRLAPDLVDEIKRAEEQGGGARIRFDSNRNNTTGNVIDVDGKNFRFTWSNEAGNKCDVYEERQSGEDGDGLLVESGCVSRKLSVQRVLDESIKNHVKKRSEEAERQQKSRKAIILDPANPSMKNQMKALAAAETTPWRGKFQQKKEPEFKKRKIDTPPVTIGGPPKSVYKSGFPSSTNITGRPSISPSPPQHFGAAASPLMTGTVAKGHMSAEDWSNQAMMKENVITSEKEKSNKATNSMMQEKPVRKGINFAKSMDLESMLVTLLTENPKGMSLKALEKAVGDSIPNAVKKIEPIIKKIAKFQAPGRYILKPGLELGSLKRHVPEGGSSPDDNAQQTPIEEKHEDTSTPPPKFAQNPSTIEEEKHALFNLNVEQDINIFDNVDIESHSPDYFGEKMIPNNHEVPARSSSNSGSDSDSDSSDSGSDSRSKSRSRSKSKSPVKSESSSDSESDASSNSKQGPDEDVDILSDDGEINPNAQISEPKFATSPIPFRASDPEPTHNWYEEKQDINGSDVEIEQDVPNDVHQTFVESDIGPHSGYTVNEGEFITNDAYKNERTSKSKSKRGSDSKLPHEKSGHSKRSKSGNLAEPQLPRPMDPIFLQSPRTKSSDRVVEEVYKSHSSQMTNRASKDGSSFSDIRKSDNQGFSGKSSRRVKASDNAENSGKNNKSQEHLSLQEDRVNSNIRDDNLHNKEQLSYSEQNLFGEKNPVVMARGKKLQRELSELELGEFREPVISEEKVEEKKFERKGSFKEIGNRPSSSDYWNFDLNKERPPIRSGALSNTETPSKRSSENKAEDTARAPSRVLQPQPKVSQHPSRADRAEVVSRKSGDTSGKSRHNEAKEKQENGVSRLGDSHTNLSVAISKHNGVDRVSVSHPKKESKTQNINPFPDSGEVKKDTSLTESSEGVVKRRESSSDENSCSFSKYEKEEPELKGPIKDFSQYKEYVQEYQEKYDSYCSLNKALESYRNEFSKLGKDLESAKGRDVDKYYRILDQLQDSYRHCGDRHKRLKKIFVVLHEELKSLKQAIKDFATSHARE